MSKRKLKTVTIAEEKDCGKHDFTESDTDYLRSKLLLWYDQNARSLPWRTRSKTETNDNVRGYSVLVSEVMLQQTQVVTVIDYYNKWMDKWPTTAALSKASLDEVNQVWAGLGYYSRGRRLWECAQIIESEHNGVVPKTVSALSKLPGVGRYTASAVASIAFNEKVGVVDGNVLRVFSRMRTIGAEIGLQTVNEFIWKVSNAAVDQSRPGDFNQALMELGATVCVPKSPGCAKCPVKSVCHAQKQNSLVDIEDSCTLCITTDKYSPDLGVMNYPKKSKKAASKEISTFVVVFHKTVKEEKVIAVKQRPSKGLLANLWELLSFEIPEDTKETKVRLLESLLEEKSLKYTDLKYIGEVPHIFSHINMKYVVYSAESLGGQGDEDLTFLSISKFLDRGTSTAMKKIMKYYESKKEQRTTGPPLKQRTINSYFKS